MRRRLVSVLVLVLFGCGDERSAEEQRAGRECYQMQDFWCQRVRECGGSPAACFSSAAPRWKCASWKMADLTGACTSALLELRCPAVLPQVCEVPIYANGGVP